MPSSRAVLVAQPVGGSAGPVRANPLRRSAIPDPPKAMHGPSTTVHVTSPTNWVSSVIVTVLVRVPLRSAALVLRTLAADADGLPRIKQASSGKAIRNFVSQLLTPERSPGHER